MTTPGLVAKAIVVTGAGSGIGRATCLALAKVGATVIACDIELERAENVVDMCERLAPAPTIPHEAHFLDVAEADQCNEVIRDVAQRIKLHGLFNCAGINPTKTDLVDTTDTYFDHLVRVNLAGTFYMTRAIIPHLAEWSGCSIINVSSDAGIRASAGFAIYNMTKFGVIGFSKSMALELGSKGIRCNIVAPGPIDTPTNRSVLAGPQSVNETSQTISLGRFGRPEEVASVVVFLFGQEARYMNGSVVEINGGLR